MKFCGKSTTPNQREGMHSKCWARSSASLRVGLLGCRHRTAWCFCGIPFKSLKFSEQLEGATHQLQHAASCCPNNRQHALEMVLHIELSRFFWWRNGSYSTGKTEQEKNCEEKHGSNSVLIRREYILTLPTVATPHPGEYMSCNPFPIDSSRKCVQPTESRILLFYLSSLAHCKQSREVVPISTVRIKGVLGVSPT